ncbi:IS3 family transposase [Streptomyces murinus]
MRDKELQERIREVHNNNYRIYGARKIWRELNRRPQGLGNVVQVRP